MPTREKIARAASQELLGRPESDFRVTAVARAAGCAPSVLYHYYDSRSGLIDAGYRTLLDDVGVAHEADAHELFEIADRAPDFAEFLSTVLSRMSRPETAPARALRARLLGVSQVRPAVREHLGTHDELVAATHRAVLRRLQDRGRLRRDVDVAALALLLRLLSDGWVLAEVSDVAPATTIAWVALGRALGTGLEAPEPYLEESAD